MITNKVVLLAAAVGMAAVMVAFTHVQGQGQSARPPAMTADMPGMDAPTMSMPTKPDAANSSSAASSPSGYAPIALGHDIEQRIGVTIGKVEETPLTMTIRAVGIVRPDETRVAHVHLKTEGWVDKLYVSFTGQNVRRGDPMLSIYSPTFFAAQREFLSALRVAQSGLDSVGDQKTIVDTARRRLELWDIPAADISALEKTGQPGKSLILRSPISGTVLEKKAFAGQYVMVANDLFVVADLSRVWMQAKIFQYELPHVAVGMSATVSFTSSSQGLLTGKVVFIDPVVDEMSRSVQVRIELPNPEGNLRPGMFGDVTMSHAMGTGLTIPASAVIRTGERDIAFQEVSEGHYAPVIVKISPTRFAGRYQVLEGLKAGDTVVTSGDFLIDSESRLDAGGGSMADMPGMSAPAKTAAKPPAKAGPKL